MGIKRWSNCSSRPDAGGDWLFPAMLSGFLFSIRTYARNHRRLDLCFALWCTLEHV